MVIYIPYLFTIDVTSHIGVKNILEKEVIEFLGVAPGTRKEKIKAIKYVKKKTGNDLREAKKQVDKIEEKYNL